MCNNEKIEITYEGCFKHFCSTHWETHRKDLSQEFHQMFLDYNKFKRKFDQFYNIKSDEHSIVTHRLIHGN